MSADSFTRGYSLFVTYLAEPAVRSLVMGCLAALGLWTLRVKRVTTHLLTWTAVLCAALAMPVLGAFLPRVRVAVPETPLMKSLQSKLERGSARTAHHEANASVALVQNVTVERANEGDLAATNKPLRWSAVKHGAGATRRAAVAQVLPRMRDFTATKPNSAGFPAVSSASALPADVPAAPTQAIGSRNFAAVASRRGIAIPWTAAVLSIYLLGVAILLARLLVGVCFSGRLERDAANIVDREAQRLLRFRSCIAGLATAPALKESRMLAVPATVGVHRAVILLPADWRAWTEEQLDAILAHEISHVARRDALTQMLSLLHRAIFWFSPLSWWLDKQLTDLAEQASDEAALAGGADRARYAETLVGFFKQLGAAPGRVWWQGVSMAKVTKASSAERRVGRILAWKESMSTKKSLALAVIALAVPVVFLAASVHPFIASAQDKPPVPQQNVIMPGGPVAPALPNAPKGGVKGGMGAPTIPPGPQGGVVAPANMAPPTGAAPVAPPALSGPRMVRPSQIPTTPAAQAPASPAPGAPNTPIASLAPAVGYAPMVPAVSYAALAPPALHAGEVSLVAPDASVQALEGQARAAKAQLDATQSACRADSANLIALKKQLDQLVAASAPVSNLRALKQQLEVLQAAAKSDNSQMLAANERMIEAQKALMDAVAAQQETSVTITNGSYTSGGGPRYVMMLNDSDCAETSCDVSMSGSDEDLEHARKLRKKINGPFIWFERDEKSYIITDAGFIAKAKALFAPEDALGKQEDELGRQEDALGKQEDALGKQEDNVKVKIPDMSADIDRVRAEMDELRKQSGATQEELGRLQSELGRLQSRVGTYQSQAGVQQSAIGRQQSDLGRQQAELGRKQAAIGRQQAEISRRATQQLRGMFDDAIAKGIAKPE